MLKWLTFRVAFIGEHPTVTITYFVPDEHKAGGKYVTITEEIKRIDAVSRQVVLMKKSGVAGINEAIDIGRIVSISGELVDYMLRLSSHGLQRMTYNNQTYCYALYKNNSLVLFLFNHIVNSG